MPSPGSLSSVIVSVALFPSMSVSAAGSTVMPVSVVGLGGVSPKLAVTVCWRLLSVRVQVRIVAATVSQSRDQSCRYFPASGRAVIVTLEPRA